jgi:hypothetical protein
LRLGWLGIAAAARMVAALSALPVLLALARLLALLAGRAVLPAAVRDRTCRVRARVGRAGAAGAGAAAACDAGSGVR